MGQRAVRVGKRLSDIAAIVAANVFIWLVWSLISAPGKFGADPEPGYLWCAAFAVLATASSVTASIASGNPVPLVWVVSALALWGLLPITVVVTIWLMLVGSVFAVLPVSFLAVPLLLASAARRLIRQGQTGRGTGLLLTGLFSTIGVSALWAPALPLGTWLPVILWHLMLAVAAVVALARDVQHPPSSCRYEHDASGIPQSPRIDRISRDTAGSPDYDKIQSARVGTGSCYDGA